MIGNYVLRLRWRVAVKQNFRPYNRRYTSPNEHFEYSYPLNIISDHKTADIPPQMKILNMVIPILMPFLTFIRQKHIILHQM